MILRRFILMAAILGLFAWRFEDTLVELDLPLLRREIAALDDSFRITDLSLHRDGRDRVIRLDANLAHRLIMNGHIVDPNPQGAAEATTLVWHALLPQVLLIAAAFALPVPRRTAYAWRVAALLPAMFALSVVDVPAILLAGLWQLVQQVLDPDHVSWWRVWSKFLQGGGEIALALTLGLLVAAIG